MLMNYLYGGSSKSTTRAEEASVVVVESPGMQGPDGDLVHTSHAVRPDNHYPPLSVFSPHPAAIYRQTELKDAANGSTDKTVRHISCIINSRHVA